MKKFIIIFILLTTRVLPIGLCADTVGELNEETNRIEYLEFREVDIKDVLRQLTKQYNLNIVFSESVGGMVTVQLHDVTVDEALDAIISINGFVYTKKENVIKVTTAEEAEQEGKQTQVFRLNNADAASLKDSLQRVLSSDGSIEVDARSNSLIVTDIPRVINEIDGMLKRDLDRRTPQVLIEARFIEATAGVTEKLGVDWSPKTSSQPNITMNGASRKTTVPFRADGSDETYKSIFPGVVSSDVPGSFPNAYGFPYAESDDFGFGTLDFTQLQMALDFLRTEEDAKVISSPRIVTVDNKEARIQIGETRRVRTEEETDSDTGITNYSYAAEDVGIILTVTPHVTPDRHIKLKLQPEVSSADEVDAATNIHIVSKRIAQTEVIIKDGQTIVIGGLIEAKKTELIKKVPFLGSIPFVGKMFSHRNTNPNEQKELLIFVTAKILEDTDEGLIGHTTGIKLSPSRPFKLDLKAIKTRKKK
ncbi:MAG: hypothetical protein GY858_02140 [Candidatus Omnitrophica bacterium]|nr:hypothetical protein [Candidatus Omnitrophota bacterium]